MSDHRVPGLSNLFRPSVYDPLTPQDLLIDELAQRSETGYDVSHVVREANEIGPEDRSGLRALVDKCEGLTRLFRWPYEEPDELAEIQGAAGTVPSMAMDPTEYEDRVLAGWLGRIAGCNLGKPVEDAPHWTRQHLRDYLHLAGAYPLLDYFPVLEPMPDGYRFRENWPQTTRGHIAGSDRDDDIDYAILALHLLEEHGAKLDADHVAQAWLSLLPIEQTFTAERATYIALVDGAPPCTAGARRNPYREWIGAQIRGDVFGYVYPGRLAQAAALAFQDATLSHRGNGIYGEMWSAALVSAAFGARNPEEAVRASLTVIPQRSRLHEALSFVLSLRAECDDWESAIDQILSAYSHYSWVHTINNAAVVAAALLWSDNYAQAVGRVVMSGLDTDSNGATVGSVAGVLWGTAGIPPHFTRPLDDRTRSALFGFDNSKISDLACRTVIVGRNLELES